MFSIPYGEHSPRVTLLQILLNSHDCSGANGRRLVVDGCYGRNTAAAVSAANRLLSVAATADDSASASVVRRLIADVDLDVIASVDFGDPTIQIDIDSLTRDGNNPIALGGMCNGLQQMVGSVLSRGRSGRVASLLFDGHGNLGRWLTISVGSVAHLPAGEYRDIEMEVLSYISSSNFSLVSGVIAPLGRLFARFGFAEHHGCSLGSRRETRAMLKKLADLWGVPVRVGVRKQMMGTMNIAGPDFTAFPRSMSLRTWSEQFQHLDLPCMSQAW
jgi:hypothetical protein